MSAPSFPLQSTLYQALAADSALMALISGLYDIAPKNAAFPYVTLGGERLDPVRSKTQTGYTYTLTLSVWTASDGHGEAKQIAATLEAALNGATLTVNDYSFTGFFLQRSDTQLQPRQRVVQTQLRYQARLFPTL